jgi:haloacetate dehalogenase
MHCFQAAMFENFADSKVDTGEAVIRVRYGGTGPPVLLLHGIPETHVMWHRLAPLLATDFTVVATDLRGYGDSSKPESTADHAPYSKRAMARDQVEVMRQLGFDRFAVVGHDRGARCAYRMALDHPERVRSLAVLDIVPTGDALNRADAKVALAYWIWFFLSQPYDLPERVLGTHAKLFLDHMLDNWSTTPDAFTANVRAEYLRTFGDPATQHAICEEYRAATTLDHQHDEADRGRRRIACPVLALWSLHGSLTQWYDVLAVWREWADDVRGRGLECGHFLAEEAPNETYAELSAFLRSQAASL